jgi:hypothetical protein
VGADRRQWYGAPRFVDPFLAFLAKHTNGLGQILCHPRQEGGGPGIFSIPPFHSGHGQRRSHGTLEQKPGSQYLHQFEHTGTLGQAFVEVFVTRHDAVNQTHMEGVVSQPNLSRRVLFDTIG